MKKLFLTIVWGISLIVPWNVLAAIAFNSSSTGGSGNASSVDFNSCNVSGSNTIGVLWVETGTGSNPTQVKWNGTDISGNAIGNGQWASGGNTVWGYYYLSPPAGTSTVHLARSSSNDLIGITGCYSGVAQTTPEATNSRMRIGSVTAINATTTTITNNDWLVSAGVQDNFSGSAGTNTTLRTQDAVFPFLYAGDSNGPQSPAGNYEQQYTWSAGTSNNGILAAALTPAGGGVTTVSIATSSQYKADGTTTLASGTSTAEHKIVFKGTLTSSSSNLLYLQVEVQPSATLFTNSPTLTSAAGVSSGNVASTTLNTDTYVDGNYHWQARARDAGASTTSAWAIFSGLATSTDFVIGGRPTGVEISDGSVNALYDFDNQALNDSSTYARNGVQGSTPFLFTTTSTKLGAAAAYDQSTGYFTATSTIMDLSGDFTIGFWMQPKASIAGGTYFFLRNTPSINNNTGITYGIACTVGHFEFVHNGVCKINTAYTFATSTWYWILLERAGSRLDAYVNDSLVQSATDSLTAQSSTVDVRFNGEVGGTGTGDMYYDEVFFATSSISTSSRDALWNGGLGMPVCVTAGCNRLAPISLQQYKSDATTAIKNGSSTTESTAVFGATLQGPTTSTLQLQVEVQPAGTAFINSPNATSTFVSTGTIATAVFGTSTLVYPRDPESWSNGSFHWQARVMASSTGATSTWQTFGATSATGTVDFKIKTVPLYTQVTSTYPSAASTTVWASALYDNALPGTQCGTGPSSSTIKACGCVITSIVMWLRYFGITTDTLGNVVDPGNINTWLTNNSGYDPGGNLYWGRITGYASSTSGVIVYDASSTSYGTSTSAVRSRIDLNLNSSTPNPVILKEMGGNHYILATGFAQSAGTSTYTVRDPYWYDTNYSNQPTSTNIKGYNNIIDGVQIYYDPPQAPALNESHVNLPNALILVDSQGRRTGKNPINGTFYHEIPGTAYDEVKGSGTGSGELFFSQLPNELYTLYVIGGKTGSYWVGGWTDYGSQKASGNIQAGTMFRYLHSYDPTSPSPVQFSYQGTVSSTASITSVPPNNLPPPPVPMPATPPPPPPPPPPAPTSTVPDTTPPVISSLGTAVASTSVTISWTTDEPADSQLLFGSSTAMVANVPPDTSFVTSHSRHIGGLVPGTTYYYEVKSKDVSGKTSTSAQQSFTTLGQ